jgi:3-oxoacyl-[acyl-carrier-protein] synthase II
MDSSVAGVAGAGVCLPVAVTPSELRDRLGTGAALTGQLRPLEVPNTNLPLVQAQVGVCADPEVSSATRRLPRECRIAVAAATQALDGLAALAPRPVPSGSAGSIVVSRSSFGTVWASSTAGMDEYGQICVEAATLEPGLVSPLMGPQAAYNGPAAAISIALGLTGPQLTLTGGREAGASALVEACRMLHEGQCEHVLVGGSATVSRWRMVGVEPGLVPSEGAVCLVLSRDTLSRQQPVMVKPLRRSRLRATDAVVDRFIGECLDLMGRPPDSVLLSVPPVWRTRVSRAVSGLGTTCWYVDEMTGDLGAAGGTQAVVAAVTACGAAGAGASSALVLALGSMGDAVAVEVASPEEWRHGSV